MLAKWGTYPYENTDGVDAVRFDVSFEFDDNPFLTSIEVRKAVISASRWATT
jgi:hypothetical protein